MVLGTFVGASDDKSGVGSVIDMSGPCASENTSQSLCSRHQHTCKKGTIVLTHMPANHSDALI